MKRRTGAWSMASVSTLAFVACASLLVTPGSAGILSSLRERIRNGGPAPSSGEPVPIMNRNLRGPSAFVPMDFNPSPAMFGPSMMVHDEQEMGNGGYGAGPSSPHRYGVDSYDGGMMMGNGGAESSMMAEPSDGGSLGGGPGGRNNRPMLQAGGLSGGEITAQQLDREFAQAGGVTLHDAISEDDDEFDFDKDDSAQVDPAGTGRQQKKSNGGGASSRRKSGYDGYGFGGPNKGRKNKNNKNKQQTQYAQERQNPGENEPADFFPYREFGEQPERDSPAEYGDYGDYGGEGGRGGGDEIGPIRDAEIDAIDRPTRPGDGLDDGPRDPAFDFDDDDRGGEGEGDRDPPNDGFGPEPAGGDGLGDGPDGDGGRGPGGPNVGFPPFEDGRGDGDGEGDREYGEPGGDDRILSDGEEPDSSINGGGGGPGGNGGGRGTSLLFGGLRNRGANGNGRPGPGASSRFSIFGRGRR